MNHSAGIESLAIIASSLIRDLAALKGISEQEAAGLVCRHPKKQATERRPGGRFTPKKGKR